MKYLIFTLLFATLIAACNSGNDPEAFKAELLTEISSLESELKQSATTDSFAINNKAAEKAIELYQQFADSFPDDPEAPEYLFKAADVAIGISRYHMAVKLFERVHNAYPKFDKAPDALYLIGFVYDEHLSYKAQAKEWYERVIKTYPDHRYAQDAQAAIGTLTMSDEELINFLKSKNQGDSLAVDSTAQPES